jgi:hypothetical protein
MGSRFTLVDPATGRTLSAAERCGVFTSAWDLRLDGGAARLVSAGWLTSGYRVIQRGRDVARADRASIWRRGWVVANEGGFEETDLLFIGLIYHTILRRRASAAAAAST